MAISLKPLSSSVHSARPLDRGSSQDANPQGSILFLGAAHCLVMATVIAGSWDKKATSPCRNKHDKKLTSSVFSITFCRPFKVKWKKWDQHKCWKINFQLAIALWSFHIHLGRLGFVHFPASASNAVASIVRAIAVPLLVRNPTLQMTRMISKKLSGFVWAGNLGNYRWISEFGGTLLYSLFKQTRAG